MVLQQVVMGNPYSPIVGGWKKSPSIWKNMLFKSNLICHFPKKKLLKNQKNVWGTTYLLQSLRTSSPSPLVPSLSPNKVLAISWKRGCAFQIPIIVCNLRFDHYPLEVWHLIPRRKSHNKNKCWFAGVEKTLWLFLFEHPGISPDFSIFHAPKFGFCSKPLYK